MNSNSQIADLTKRKNISLSYIRSLSPEEKIAHLLVLQEQYYEMLTVREANGGHQIPEKWRKWHTAGHADLSEPGAVATGFSGR